MFEATTVVWGAVGFRNGGGNDDSARNEAIAKFRGDLERMLKEKRELQGYVFFTNVDLTPQQHTELKRHAISRGVSHVDLFDFERLRHVLDSPEGLIARLQYLSITMSATEQIALVSKFGGELQRVVTARLDRVERTLLAAAEENKALAAESHALITGGDGFCYLRAVVAGDRVALVPINDSKYTQYDVHISVTDQNESRKFMEDHMLAYAHGAPLPYEELIRRTTRDLPIGTMPAGTAGNIMLTPLQWSMDGIDDRGFLISVMARNGALMQIMRVRKVPNPPPKLGVAYATAFGLQVATRVTRGEKTVIETGIDWLPRKEDGKVDWDLPNNKESSSDDSGAP
ncbi:MAG TPA: hypothetical protein VGD37_21070 [Kofleriaceae bacterium]